MAYPVFMYKDYEDEEVVIYRFCIRPNNPMYGRIQLNKKTELINELLSLPEVSSGLASWVFNRAGLRISKAFRDGNFPESMEIIH